MYLLHLIEICICKTDDWSVSHLCFLLVEVASSVSERKKNGSELRVDDSFAHTDTFIILNTETITQKRKRQQISLGLDVNPCTARCINYMEMVNCDTYIYRLTSMLIKSCESFT